VAIVSINIELVAEIPLTINESSRQEGQSYVDLITEAATAFMENNDLNQLDFQVKVVALHFQTIYMGRKGFLLPRRFVCRSCCAR